MAAIIIEVFKGLGGIGVSVGKSIKNDLLFPPTAPSLEHQIVSQLRGKDSMIRAKEYDLSMAHVEVRRKEKYLRVSQEALAQKDRVIRSLQERIRSLELQLQNCRNRRR